MRKDYQKIFNDLKGMVSVLGVTVIYEDDLVSEFLLSNGWKLILKCERYYALTYSIEIKHNVHGSFTVWMLMRVFKVLRNNEYGNPTIENQINFLFSESELIFSSSIFYKEKYDLMNTISYD